MELRQLRYFVTVVDEGSFTRAAERLHIAQPPLSRQIQQFEEELGVQLLDRKSRPLSLTDAGRFVYEHALDVLERIEVMQMMTNRLGRFGQGRFTIGFVGSTLYGPLPEVVRRFRNSYPDLEVSLLELTTVQQVEALKKQQIDVGFGRLYLDDPAVRREVLREEVLVAAVPLGHPLLNRIGPLKLDELVSGPLIVYPKTPRPSYADQVLSLFQDRGMRLASLHEVSGLQTALGLVAAGIGVCLVPECVQQLRRGDVIYRALEDEQAVSPVIMSYRVYDESREIALLLELIRDLYRDDLHR